MTTPDLTLDTCAECRQPIPAWMASVTDRRFSGPRCVHCVPAWILAECPKCGRELTSTLEYRDGQGFLVKWECACGYARTI